MKCIFQQQQVKGRRRSGMGRRTEWECKKGCLRNGKVSREWGWRGVDVQRTKRRQSKM